MMINLELIKNHHNQNNTFYFTDTNNCVAISSDAVRNQTFMMEAPFVGFEEEVGEAGAVRIEPGDFFMAGDAVFNYNGNNAYTSEITEYGRNRIMEKQIADIRQKRYLLWRQKLEARKAAELANRAKPRTVIGFVRVNGETVRRDRGWRYR